MDRFTCGLVEIKLASDGDDQDAMSFTGYGAVFNNIDAGGDLIEPGAFASFLADVKGGKQRWPAMMSQHGGMGLTAEDLTPIGVWTDFSEDGHGLKVSGKFADTPRGIEMYKLMKMTPRPAIDSLSIGYIPKEIVPRTSPDEPRRRLKRIDLIEVSPVTRPMNGLARITSVKSIEQLGSIRDAEDYLRESGMSRAAAVAFMARVKCLGQSDSDGGELKQLVEQIRANTAFIPT